MVSSLKELNALLDNFIPLTKKISIAKTAALEKEAEVLEKILVRAWMIMPYLHENGEPGQCALINRTERVPTGQDSGFSVSNKLTLLDDGPRLVRSFAVEQWESHATCFEINDSKDINCLDAIKTYGFEDICAGLVEMLKCQISIAVEFEELQTRIERADSLLSVLGEKFKAECRASEEAHGGPASGFVSGA